MLNFWLAAQRGRDELPLASVQVASLLEGARYCTRSLYPFRSLRPPLDIPPDNTDAKTSGACAYRAAVRRFAFRRPRFEVHCPVAFRRIVLFSPTPP
jgi:hypothetical protein